jgi:MoaA/NifB/PqqE/SkfB family radical SAM enzyme
VSRSPTVEWQVAGACNYDCSYCIQSRRHRKGNLRAEQIDAAVATLATLPGSWEIKCSGGEAFAHRLFVDRLVPALMERTPHRLSVLTNLSASPRDLMRFVRATRGRLEVFSASLHVEHVTVEAFVDKVAWLADLLDPQTRLVVNQVVLPGRLDLARRGKEATQERGLRWFPQLLKVKGRVARYPDEAALAALIGDHPGPREANLSPSYEGRRCWAGVDYFTVDKDGSAWSCRSARRVQRGRLGNLLDGSLRRWSAPRPCPYPTCPCTVPANRGMIEGLP